MDETKKLVRNITKGIQEKKGNGIVIADLTKVEGAICRYFVICQGNSPTQVEAITESIGDFVRQKSGDKPTKQNSHVFPTSIETSYYHPMGVINNNRRYINQWTKTRTSPTCPSSI